MSTAVESLEKYDLRDRVLIRLADLVFFCAISLIGKTIRWEIQGIEHLDAVTAAGKQPIYCLWHDRIFAGNLLSPRSRHRRINIAK
jgi:lysophospholipid acyltransferase (LPLAT)-like uncharacterized protein